MVGVAQSYPVALDGFHQLIDSIVLCYDRFAQLRPKILEAGSLGFHHALHRHPCHARHDRGHLGSLYRCTYLDISLLPGFLQLYKLMLHVHLFVTETRGQFVFLFLHGQGLFVLQLLQETFLFGNFLWHFGVCEMHVGTHLVHHVYGLVGEIAAIDISIGQLDAHLQCLVSIGDRMVALIAVTYIEQYFQCFLGRCLVDGDLLEPALQRPVFLNGVVIFLVGRGSDTLYLSSGEGGLQDVGGIHAARVAARADDGMYLVYKHDDVWILFQFIHQGFQAFLKLPAIFCASHYGRHVEANQPFVEKNGRSMAVDDALRQSFHDSALAYAWLAQQDGIVLLAPAKYLGDAIDFFLPADNGIQFTVPRGLRQVGGELVQYRSFGLIALFVRGIGSVVSVAVAISRILLEVVNVILTRQ